MEKRPKATTTPKETQRKPLKDYPPVGQHERYLASVRQRGIDSAIAATKAAEPLLKGALAND